MTIFKDGVSMTRRIRLLIAMCLVAISLMACGGSSDSSKKESADDIVKSAVKADVMAHYGLKYDIKNCIVNVTTIKEAGDNEYEVYGKANIIDNYGDKWEASFDGKCTVNGEKGRAHNMNYGEPKKQ